MFIVLSNQADPVIAGVDDAETGNYMLFQSMSDVETYLNDSDEYDGSDIDIYELDTQYPLTVKLSKKYAVSKR